jgi:hypothetical protein
VDLVGCGLGTTGQFSHSTLEHAVLNPEELRQALSDIFSSERGVAAERQGLDCGLLPVLGDFDLHKSAGVGTKDLASGDRSFFLGGSAWEGIFGDGRRTHGKPHFLFLTRNQQVVCHQYAVCYFQAHARYCCLYC